MIRVQIDHPLLRVAGIRRTVARVHDRTRRLVQVLSNAKLGYERLTLNDVCSHGNPTTLLTSTASPGIRLGSAARRSCNPKEAREQVQSSHQSACAQWPT
jgi:hypothetical protein